MKLEFVQLALQEGACVRELCRRFNISAPCAYKWIGRYQRQGPAGLQPLSRQRRGQPTRTAPEVEELLLELRDEHPAWGARKLKRRLQNLGHDDLPAHSTITAILGRHDRLHPNHPSAQGPWQRFVHPHPNDLWQMDFKGDFALHRGQRCFPLTVLDDHSRYALAVQACPNQQAATVRAGLTQVFDRYGLPWRLLCDNGSPWGGAQRQDRFSALGVWLLRLGVDLCHGRPYHPQTQGKDERFHRTLKAELLARSLPWPDLPACQSDFSRFRATYNQIRPHDALNLEVPASLYRPSARSLPKSLALPEYLPGDFVRRVKAKGEITFRNHFFYVGRAFADLPVALRPAHQDGLYDLFFDWKKLGTIDLLSPKLPKFSYNLVDPPVPQTLTSMR